MTRCCVWLERMNARPVADGIMKLLVIRVMRSSHYRFFFCYRSADFPTDSSRFYQKITCELDTSNNKQRLGN